VNASPHIGFAYEAVLADVIARYHRARGRDVFFLSGTDDNSLKNVRAAEKQGLPVEELVERNAKRFYLLKQTLLLSFDDFIRTSKDERHFAAVEAIWRACAQRGDIYEAEYSGLYCVGCERFYAGEELTDGLCPEHFHPLELVEERNWFFRLSRYGEALIERIRSRELRILPESRRAEILSFVEGGLEDFSISRSRDRAHGWGIPVPGDPSQVIYVWFDALINYVSALDYAADGTAYRRYWSDGSTQLHVIGKGILRFHAAYWPAILLSAGLPLPSTILVHGYLTLGGRKISKSLGGTVDPHDLSARFGPDALRYYLLSQIDPGADGDFTEEGLGLVHDKDLSDQLGNLASRVTSMIGRYFGGRVPAPRDGRDGRLSRSVEGLLQEVDRCLTDLEVRDALHRIWSVVREANRYVVAKEPWRLARQTDARSRAELESTLYDLAEVTRIVGAFSAPFIPGKAAQLATAFSLEGGWDRLTPETTRWGGTKPGVLLKPSGVLFPKRRDA
jgi:methionyl-tRNA synthetase